MPGRLPELYKYLKYSSLVTEIGGDIQGKGVGEIVEKQCLKTLKRLQNKMEEAPRYILDVRQWVSL
jgi:hypothetical protein